MVCELVKLTTIEMKSPTLRCAKPCGLAAHWTVGRLHDGVAEVDNPRDRGVEVEALLRRGSACLRTFALGAVKLIVDQILGIKKQMRVTVKEWRKCWWQKRGARCKICAKRQIDSSRFADASAGAMTYAAPPDGHGSDQRDHHRDTETSKPKLQCH